MATLEELQDQLAALKERYSEVIEGSYSAEESIATIAVNMQAQLDDAQAAASSAGVYAAAAESAADEAADAGAEAGTAAGAEAGTTAAQDKYDAIFTQENTWSKTQTFYSLKANNVNVTSFVKAQDIDVYSQVKAGELKIENLSGSVRAAVVDSRNELMTLQLDNDWTDNVLLTCYSAALQYCNVENTLSVGQLLIGDTTLSQSELAQLKALLNQ